MHKLHTIPESTWWVVGVFLSEYIRMYLSAKFFLFRCSFVLCFAAYVYLFVVLLLFFLCPGCERFDCRCLFDWPFDWWSGWYIPRGRRSAWCCRMQRWCRLPRRIHTARCWSWLQARNSCQSPTPAHNTSKGNRHLYMTPAMITNTCKQHQQW